MSQSNCQFPADFQWLPEVGDLLPEVGVGGGGGCGGCDSFFNQIKKCWLHPGESKSVVISSSKSVL